MNITLDLSKISLEDLETMLQEARSAQRNIDKNPDVPIRTVSMYHLGKGEPFSVETVLYSAFVLQELERIEETITSAIKKRTVKP